MRAYNLFRRKGVDAVYCAVPEDCAVPRFLTTNTWAFSGKVQEPAATPIGFNESAANTSIRFNGFISFTPSRPLSAHRRREPLLVRCKGLRRLYGRLAPWLCMAKLQRGLARRSRCRV